MISTGRILRCGSPRISIFSGWLAHKIAYKLYRSSYNRGAKLFYPPTFLFLDYLLKYASYPSHIEKEGEVVLRKTA